MVILLGLLLTASSSVTFLPSRAESELRAQEFAAGCRGWRFPSESKSGFSSAGAGALGTVLLLNYSEMTPPEVVGTDLLFGLVLAVIGSAFHWKFGSINGHVLAQLLAGGIPGVRDRLLASRKPRARAKAEVVIAVIAIFAGLQLVWTGARTMIAQRAALNA